jgi:glutathione S-transferase
MMLTLYLAPGASSMAPHVALYEAGIEFKTHVLSFKAKQHRSPEFLVINAEGKVPALVLDDGRVITEVAAILFYIGRRFPAAALWPEGDVAAQAQVIAWMSYCASTLHPARRQGMDTALKIYGFADRKLDANALAAGAYSITDIHLFQLYWRLRNSFLPETSWFPSLEWHYDRMMERRAVERTIAAESAAGYELPV